MKRKRRIKRRMIRLLFLAVLAAALLTAGFLFRVRNIKIYGNERHTAKEISQGLLHDVIADNTLHLLWLYRDGEVPDTLPFLDSVQVKMKSPSSVEVAVTEKQPAGCIDKGEYVYFDGNGMVLEISDEHYDGIPLVTGASTDDPVLYQKLPTQSSAQLRTMLSLLDLLNYHELEAQEIRFGENMEIRVYIGSVEAELGQDEYLEEKVANMKAILSSMDGESGTLHLESFTGKNEDVTFTYSNEPQTQDNADTGMADGGDASGTSDEGGETGAQDGLGETDASGDGSGSDVQNETSAGTSDEGGTSASDLMGEGTPDTDSDTGASSGVPFMAFNSSGTLVYDVRVVNGVAVDGNGIPVYGCTVNEDGYVVDAYMNVIDPATGQPVNLQ